MAGVGSVSSQFNVGKVQFSSSDMRGEIPSGGLHQGQYSNLENRLGPAYKVELSTQAQTNSNSPEIRHLKQIGAIECQTCKQRRYQDVSNDPGVYLKHRGIFLRKVRPPLLELTSRSMSTMRKLMLAPKAAR